MSCNFCDVPKEGPLVFDEIIYDVGGFYDNSTGKFRAPATGRYLVNVRIHGKKHEANFFLRVNGKERTWTIERNEKDSDGEVNSYANVVLRLDKDDMLHVDPWHFGQADDHLKDGIFGSYHDPTSMRSWFGVTLLTTVV